jgi:hypothetical protein
MRAAASLTDGPCICLQIRKRAAVEAHRRKKEAETISMRADLKQQKEDVDSTNLANARALVARVRADTAHDKIRLAKTAFVDQRVSELLAPRAHLPTQRRRRIGHATVIAVCVDCLPRCCLSLLLL